MIVVSGDIHGSTTRITLLREELRLTAKDILILLGDVEANYFCDDRDKPIKEQLQKLTPTILCMRRIRLHDLRHSCASLLPVNGVSLKDIQS